ncbi:MAG: acetyltransferase/hydrolase [Gammaproteobacteria bacterium]|nr:MAG: acetyltransferase/hydrolase [Gammaproteobacteria bacterium]
MRVHDRRATVRGAPSKAPGGIERRGRRGPEVTFLVHGIWQHGSLLGLLSRVLGARGLNTRPLSYDFLNRSPEQNAAALYRTIQRSGARRVNLVAHSLGGIVVLHLLEQHPEMPIGRIVFLGSPVKGSFVAERMHANRLLRPLLGRSIERGLLGGAPRYKGPWPLGIITGSGSFGISSLLYPVGEDSDGVVREQETELDNVSDRIRLPYSHSNLVFSRRCAEQVAEFLLVGRFRHGPADAAGAGAVADKPTTIDSQTDTPSG